MEAINELLRLKNGGIETKISILALLVLKIEPFSGIDEASTLDLDLEIYQ